MSSYPCQPVPFTTMFGDVMMCGKCGHGPAPKECRASSAPATGEREQIVGWQDIASAPFNTPVRVKAGSMTFLARLIPNAAMATDEQVCDQWQAEVEGEHPPCWSGGACWESNEDEALSLQPTQWMPAEAIARGDHRTQSGEMEGGEHG